MVEKVLAWPHARVLPDCPPWSCFKAACLKEVSTFSPVLPIVSSFLTCSVGCLDEEVFPIVLGALGVGLGGVALFRDGL